MRRKRHMIHPVPSIERHMRRYLQGTSPSRLVPLHGGQRCTLDSRRLLHRHQACILGRFRLRVHTSAWCRRATHPACRWGTPSLSQASSRGRRCHGGASGSPTSTQGRRRSSPSCTSYSRVLDASSCLEDSSSGRIRRHESAYLPSKSGLRRRQVEREPL